MVLVGIVIGAAAILILAADGEPQVQHVEGCAFREYNARAHTPAAR